MDSDQKAAMAIAKTELDKRINMLKLRCKILIEKRGKLSTLEWDLDEKLMSAKRELTQVKNMLSTIYQNQPV